MSQGLLNLMKADAPSVLWLFDDAPGSTIARDVSGNGRDLDYWGSPTLQNSQVIPGDNKVWGPILGGDDYAARQSSPLVAAVNPGSGDFLYTCWVRGNSVNPSEATFSTIFNLDLNDSGNGIDIYIVDTWTGASTGTLRVWYGGTVWQCTLANQGASLFDGNPHLIWVEKRSGTLSLYVDGFLGPSSAAGTPNVGGTTWVQVGNSYAQGVTYRHHNPISYVGIWANTTIPAFSRLAAYMAEARRSGVVY
jgi:hypothetical protein